MDGESSTRISSTIRASSPCGTAQFMLLPLIKPPYIPDRHHAGAASRCRALGEALKHFDMQLIRGAGAAGRNKDRGGAHAYRVGRAGAARRPRRGHDGRRAGRSRRARPASASSWPPSQSGRPILPVAIATKRYLALNTWSRMKINLPYSSVGFAVGPLVTGAARCDARGAREAIGRRSRTR